MQYTLTAFLVLLLANPLCLCGGLVGHAHPGPHEHRQDTEQDAPPCGHHHPCSSHEGHEGHDSHHHPDPPAPAGDDHQDCPCLADHSDARATAETERPLPAPALLPSGTADLPAAGRSPTDLRTLSHPGGQTLLTTGPDGLLQVICVLRV